MDEEAIVREIISIPHRCCICGGLERIEFDYMSEIQYQVTRNNKVESDFIKKGFCKYHFWTSSSLTTPEAVASMGAMLIENNSFSPNSCLVCEHLKTKEAEFVNEFKKDIMGVAFENSEQSEKRHSRHERDKNERTSWWRAIEKLVGRKGTMS